MQTPEVKFFFIVMRRWQLEKERWVDLENTKDGDKVLPKFATPTCLPHLTQVLFQNFLHFHTELLFATTSVSAAPHQKPYCSWKEGITRLMQKEECFS